MNERVKKIGLSIFLGILIILAILAYLFFPLKKEAPEVKTRKTLVAEDIRIKCDLVEIAHLGGEDKTDLYTLKVESGETIGEYVMDESYEVYKTLSIISPKVDEKMPLGDLSLTDRYYVLLMVGDIEKVETLSESGEVVSELYRITNARSEYRMIPVCMLEEYDSIHLEDVDRQDVKIMSRSEFMSKMKNVEELDTLIHW